MSNYIVTPRSVPSIQSAVDAGVVSGSSPILVENVTAYNSPVRSMNLSTNALSNTPRYPMLTTNSPRALSNSIKVETIPNISTPEPELINGKPFIVTQANARTQIPVQINVGGEVSDDEIVENELIKYGYTILSKINIEEPNGKQCMYIKAVNRLGQVLLVELDVHGLVTESTRDLTIVKSLSGISRNYSLKVGEIECMKLSGCNLGYICNDGVCVMENDSGDIKEQNFEFVKPFAAREVVIDDNLVAIPVVHMSDIRSNNVLVLKNVNILTKKLRSNSYKHMVELLKETREKIKSLNDNFNNYVQVKHNDEQRLMKSIKTLEEFLLEYDKKALKCSWTKIDVEKVKEITANLAIRTVKFQELLKSMKSVTNMNKSLDSINSNIIENTKFLKTDFEHIDKVYDV